jgi:hypothetical protein
MVCRFSSHESEGTVLLRRGKKSCHATALTSRSTSVGHGMASRVGGEEGRLHRDTRIAYTPVLYIAFDW